MNYAGAGNQLLLFIMSLPGEPSATTEYYRGKGFILPLLAIAAGKGPATLATALACSGTVPGSFHA